MHEYTMGGLLERACRSYGPRVAVIDGDRRITYSELISTVRKNGRALLSTGLRPGDRVALLMPDRPELLYAYYGALWAGLSVVPLNARLGAEDQEYILTDSGAKAVVHDRAYAGRLADILGNTSIEHRLGVDEDAILDGGSPLGALADKESDAAGVPAVAPDDLFGIYYTGGTTGRPKGVTH